MNKHRIERIIKVSSVLVNFLGMPSCGKSSTAAKLFARLKDMSVSVEYTQEYVKSWAWDNRPISPYDQFYFFGKEAHNQSHLFNKVDVIISDSPVLLTAFYHWHYNKNNALRQICKDFYSLAEKDGITTYNLFLPRKKAYDSNGRYQTEEQAEDIGRRLRQWLEVECYDFIDLDCEDEERVDKIIDLVL